MRMLRIAICDDLQSERDTVNLLLRSFFAAVPYEYAITEYICGEALVDDYDDGSVDFDLIFMDIFMDGMLVSRLTKGLAGLLMETGKYDRQEELILEDEPVQALNSERLNRRTGLIEKGEYDNEMFRYARQFKQADCIVISAPYCRPHGLCRAKKLYYVTTSGGYVGGGNYGYEIVKSMAGMFGIGSAECILAEGLDINTNDVEAILERTAGEMRDRMKL